MEPPIDITLDELLFRVSRSSGPGGQHVNKTDTKVEVLWHVGNTLCLNDDQKQRIAAKLANRINKEGYLGTTCQQTRSQLTNKEKAIAKLRAMVSKALEEEKPRKPTKVSKAVKEKRIKAKKVTALKKQARNDWRNQLYTYRRRAPMRALRLYV
jgi:ribosome-associated protein